MGQGEAVQDNVMQPETRVAWRDLYELDIVQRARKWNQIHDVDTIAGINRRIKYGGYEGLVRDADKAYDDTICRAAGAIATQRDGIRLVVVAGPSSSGKTTTTLKLCEALRNMGQDLQLLSLDNYFWNLKNQPQDELGDRNFETPDALDKGLINQNLKDLIDGREAVTPIYNFKAGEREAEGVPIKLSPGQLLVVEGLHGFHRELTSGIPHEQQFKIYIEAICQLKDGRGDFIPWTDIRLLRRMVRDNLFRNYTPIKTLKHWHYVRSAEKKHIVPFLNSTEVVVNGYLPYELPVHKKYLFQNLEEAVKQLEKEDGREDAYRRACRCLGYLKEVDPLQDDSVIPATSLLREFIGGSAYE